VNANRNRNENSLPGPPVGPNPFLEISQNIPTVEYKKGYVMRKCCIDSNNKKSEYLRLKKLVEGEKISFVHCKTKYLFIALECLML
jgi:hypothetical protein